MRALLIAAAIVALAGCVKQPPAGRGPLFKAGEEWAFRYRDANGVPCVVVVQVTDYVYGVRRSESCTTAERGTFVPDGPDERRIDITTIEGVERPGIRESPRKPSSGEQFAAGCLGSVFQGICSGIFR